MNTIDEDYVSILVPKRHLMEAYGFIASLENSEGTGQASEGVEVNEKEKAWTPELIRRQYLESPDIIKRFQKILADHPGVWFSTSQMAKKLNAEHGSKTLAGALGAFGRRRSNRYKMRNGPFETRWMHTEGQQSYSVTTEVAEIIGSL